MKILSLCIIVALMSGCKTPVKKNINNACPDPVTFSWIKSAKVLNLKTVNIYYKGVAKGEFLGNKQWRGTITGDIFCKPLNADKLLDGLYIPNGTVKVNENSTIETKMPFSGKIISFSKKGVNISCGKNFKMTGKSIICK